MTTLTAKAKKYSHINFKPPASVTKAAQRGLELRKKFKKGGLSTQEAGKQGIGSGVARATSLSRRSNVSPKVIKQMCGYFSRHAKDKKPGWSNASNPSKGYIAWLLWGGNPGRGWANKVKRQMEAADKKVKASAVYVTTAAELRAAAAVLRS